MKKSMFLMAGILLLSLWLLPGLSGCGAVSSLMATPTPTATSTSTATSTPTLTPTPTITPTPLPPFAVRLIIFDPFYNMTTTFKRFNSPAQAEWEIVDGVLHGDISGNEYKFEMALASIGEAQFTFQLILQQGAQRIPLAESSFSVNRQEFDVYTSTVRGIDPASRSGDKLLLAADINCNGCGILFGDSQVWIPGVRR